MLDLNVILFFLAGSGAGCAALFLSYQLIAENAQQNIQSSYKKYERNDQWQKKTFHGSTRTHSK